MWGCLQHFQALLIWALAFWAQLCNVHTSPLESAATCPSHILLVHLDRYSIFPASPDEISTLSKSSAKSLVKTPEQNRARGGHNKAGGRLGPQQGGPSQQGSQRASLGGYRNQNQARVPEGWGHGKQSRLHFPGTGDPEQER